MSATERDTAKKKNDRAVLNVSVSHKEGDIRAKGGERSELWIIWGNRDVSRMNCKCKDLEAGAVDWS